MAALPRRAAVPAVRSISRERASHPWPLWLPACLCMAAATNGCSLCSACSLSRVSWSPTNRPCASDTDARSTSYSFEESGSPSAGYREQTAGNCSSREAVVASRGSTAR